MKIDRVLVAGGGTGGHLFPGLAVVEELRRRLPELDVLFVGTSRGIEARVLPGRGERFVPVEVRPLLGRSLPELARNVAELPRATLEAIGVVRSFRPDLALGLGGYAAGPVLLAAATLRVPSALLEANVQLGLTNRLLSKTVGRAYLSYEQTAAQFGPARARVVGNPIRRAFVEAARTAAHDPAGIDARGRGVLVFGGSQGARGLNEQVPAALARAGVRELGIPVVHQAGAAALEQVQARYAALGIAAQVVPFIDDMVRAYIDASLVIGRAGGSTMAELCAIGRPGILVPLPTSAGNHQLVNARAFEQAGAGIAVEESALDPERLGVVIAELLADRPRRIAMGHAARRLAKPEAAAAIVDDIFAWLQVSNGSTPDAEPEPHASGGNGGATDLDAAADGASSPLPVRRRPKVKRAALRLRQIDTLGVGGQSPPSLMRSRGAHELASSDAGASSECAPLRRSAPGSLRSL
jgi:UDP-N-acetylglucosamine--N-acetylmuramyl-(pentapeptide) pyrophosphoryl-undecaprenol N-acetylglucosamine transferase